MVNKLFPERVELTEDEFRQLINDIIEEFIPKSHKRKRKLIRIFAMQRFWEIGRLKLEEG